MTSNSKQKPDTPPNEEESPDVDVEGEVTGAAEGDRYEKGEDTHPETGKDRPGLIYRVLEYFGLDTKTPESQEESKEVEGATPDEEVKDERDIVEKEKKSLKEKTQDVRKTLEQVIEPEERNIENFLSVNFWKGKWREYKKVKKKGKEDLDIYRMLKDSAAPTIEYYILTLLSSIIATLGLIMGSSAVIIGAMIVAPLMTPILALSLGVVWGDLRFMGTSIKSVFFGTLLAILIASMITFVVPELEYSQEILSRTRPSLYDIIIALASGIVGAYGYANKKISNALVGIAIAVALLPPLCTVGIGLGTLNMEVALGSATLFIINLVSISLAGAVVFWIMKIHPLGADEEEVKRRAMFQIITTVMILVVISVPLGFYMFDAFSIGKAKSDVRETVVEGLPETAIFELEIEKVVGGYAIYLTLMGDAPPSPSEIDTIKEMIGELDSIRYHGYPNINIRFIKREVLTE